MLNTKRSNREYDYFGNVLEYEYDYFPPYSSTSTQKVLVLEHLFSEYSYSCMFKVIVLVLEYICIVLTPSLQYIKTFVTYLDIVYCKYNGSCQL